MRSFWLRATQLFRNSAILATATTIAVSAASTGAILGIAGGRLGGVDRAGPLRPATTGSVWSPPVALSVRAAEAARVATSEGATAVLAANSKSEATNSNGRQAPLLGDSGAPGDFVGAAPQTPVAQVRAAGDGHKPKKTDPSKSGKKFKDSHKKANDSAKDKKNSSNESNKKPKKFSVDSDKNSKKDDDD